MIMKKKYQLAGFLFVLPSLLYYIFIFLYPLILSFVNSFYKINLLMGSRTFLGLTNYTNLFSRDQFWQSSIITIKYVLIAVPILMIIDLWVADELAKMKGIKSLILSTLVFLPFIVSMVSAGMIWDWLFDPNLGLINTVLRTLGVGNPPSWLRSPSSALYSTIIISLWVRAPFGIMIFIGAIKNVSLSLYEAADLDGASPTRKFFSITLPLINPQVIVVLTLETIFAFRAFDLIYTATGGGPGGSTKTIMIYMIKDLFNQNYGIASALTVIMLLVLFGISLAEQIFLTKKIDY